MDLSSISTDELIKALQGRVNQVVPTRPEPDHTPQMVKIIEMCESIVDEHCNGTWHEDNDDAVYMYEAVMTAVYGEDIFARLREIRKFKNQNPSIEIK